MSGRCVSERGYRHEDSRLSVRWPLVERLGRYFMVTIPDPVGVLNKLFNWWC